MTPYDDVYAAWARLSSDGHVGMSDAVTVAAAAANSLAGRRALAEILAEPRNLAITDADALSYLRITRDVPLPPNVHDHRADGFFRTRLYTGTRTSKTHRVENPRELLYFDFAIVMILGTLDDVSGVRELMRGSRFEPVLIAMPDGRDTAIGVVMVNEFRDTTFGPYNEVIFMALAVPEDAPDPTKRIEYVNPFSLQLPLDRGAWTYVFKLWLNELSPIDGGNDFLGTNKELGSFRFTDLSNGTREIRSWDSALAPLFSATIPRGMPSDTAHASMAAYRAAAERAGITLPAGTSRTIPVASRPDGGASQPAYTWGFAVEWRQIVVQPVTNSGIELRLGRSGWGERYARLGFTSALCFYAPAGVGQVLQHIGDCPYSPADAGAQEAVRG